MRCKAYFTKPCSNDIIGVKLTLHRCWEVAFIKNYVKKLREEKGLTQEQLAKKVHVSRQTINAIETGRYKPSIILALKMANIFELPMEQIFILEPSDWE